MNQPTHRDKARKHLESAEAALQSNYPGAQGTAAITAAIGQGFAVLAHLDALALPEPGAGDAILAAARKLTTELGFGEDHDHRGLTLGPDDQAQDVIPGAHVAAVAPETASLVSRDAGNGDGDLRADLVSVVSPAIVGFIDAEIQFVPEARSHALTLTSAGLLTDVVVAALTEAGWRPPLPDGGQDLAEHVGHEIRQKLDWHQWPGCDWTNASLSDIAGVALAAVMPFLDEPKPDTDIVGRRHHTGRLEVESDTSPWYVRILDEQVHHTSEEAPSLIDWTADGRMIGVELLGSGRERTMPDEIAVIADERRRVVDVEGRTPEHDDGYVHGQLAYAAAAYLGATVGSPTCLYPGQLWPWGYQHFKPGDALANLVKAGQLVAAEIARLQRTRASVERDQSTSDTAEPRFPYRQMAHDLCGSNSERQSVGDPGHCEDCCSVGHVVAHPDLGCGDVGCYRTHGDEEADRG